MQPLQTKKSSSSDSSESNDSSDSNDKTTLYTKKFNLPKTYLPTTYVTVVTVGTVVTVVANKTFFTKKMVSPENFFSCPEQL